MLQAHQLMDPRVPRVRRDESRESCVRLLGPRQHLLVIGDQGQLVGVARRGAIEQSGDAAAAAELSVPVPTVPPHVSASEALRTLLRSDAGALAVVDQANPLGLLTLEDAVQVARFVLPPSLRVRDVMSAPLPEAIRLASSPLLAEHEARQGADALTQVLGPVAVMDPPASRLDPVGAFRSQDAVRALLRMLDTSPRPAPVRHQGPYGNK